MLKLEVAKAWKCTILTNLRGRAWVRSQLGSAGHNCFQKRSVLLHALLSTPYKFARF